MTTKQVIYTKVAGTTFENRQDVIAEMVNEQICVLIKEPENAYDPNAIGVWCCWEHSEEWRREQIGYIPKDRTAELAPKIGDEPYKCSVDEITGGFATSAGQKAYFGVVLRIEV